MGNTIPYQSSYLEPDFGISCGKHFLGVPTQVTLNMCSLSLSYVTQTGVSSMKKLASNLIKRLRVQGLHQMKTNLNIIL